MLTKIPELQSLTERYETMPLEPLVITVTLQQAIIHYDHVNLDNLLARAVLEAERFDVSAMDKTKAYELPVPLKKIWMSDEGLPLWAASVFLPVGEIYEDSVFLHKRVERFEFSERQPNVKCGRWMARRMPKTTYQSESKQWQSFCIGNAEEIKKVLPFIGFLGKHRSVGFGEIKEWDVSKWDGNDVQTIVKDNRLIHAIPQEVAGVLGIEIEDIPYLVGWTPPQWKPALWSQGYMVGTNVQ